jgi:hypothetical protein
MCLKSRLISDIVLLTPPTSLCLLSPIALERGLGEVGWLGKRGWHRCCRARRQGHYQPRWWTTAVGPGRGWGGMAMALQCRVGASGGSRARHGGHKVTMDGVSWYEGVEL